MSGTQERERDLTAARVGFQEAWGTLRRSVHREVGREPKGSQRWLLPLLAAAAGVAAGFAMRARRKRRR